MKKLIFLTLCMLMWNGQAMAVQTCQTASITADTPTADFTDNGNGTVTHTKTSLMWKRCSEGQAWNGTTCTGTATTYSWQGALQQAETLNNGGGFATFTNWRVPNIKELSSIVERQCASPAINAAIFPATVNSQYWSASPIAANATNAWDVSFPDGLDFVRNKSGSVNVRLVRGGQ
ncbi:MAG: DUF1566 domain-containing protein [Mariprofundaceae bacterium]